MIGGSDAANQVRGARWSAPVRKSTPESDPDSGESGAGTSSGELEWDSRLEESVSSSRFGRPGTSDRGWTDPVVPDTLSSVGRSTSGDAIDRGSSTPYALGMVLNWEDTFELTSSANVSIVHRRSFTSIGPVVLMRRPEQLMVWPAQTMSSKFEDLSEWAGQPAQSKAPALTWLVSQGKRFSDAIRYSSAYLAAIAMAEVVITTKLLSLPLTLAPLVVGLVTFSVYTIDRVADAEADALSNPKQASFARRNENVLYVLASVAYGSAVAISALGGPLAFGSSLLPGMLWILYASDWLPAITPSFQRLKNVFLVNTVVVAFAWAVTVTLLPIAFAGASFTPAAALVFAYFFLGTFVNAEIPNVRDIESDRASGASTLPIVLGVRRTRNVLYGIDLCIGLLVGYAVLEGYLSVVLAAALVVGLVYSVAVTGLLGRYDRDGLLTIVAESEYLVVAGAMLLAVSSL